MMNNDNSSFFTSLMQAPSPGTVEVAKKPRGRPRGSKNKPNKEAAPLPVPCVGGDVMAPYILEVPHGNDIVRAISQFSISKNTGLCVLAASGTITNASLRPSSAASAPGVTFPGVHTILSMSGTFAPHQYPTADYAPKPLAVSLISPNGHVFGGVVLGSLVSDGSVYVIAISFNCPSYNNISSHEVEQSVPNTAAAGGETGYAPSFNCPSYYNISSHEVEQSVPNTAAAGGETGYAPSFNCPSYYNISSHEVEQSVPNTADAGGETGYAPSFNCPSYYNISSHEVEPSVPNTAATREESGYAPSHLPGGIPMYRDELTAVNGLWPPAMRSSQPPLSTHQYLT